MKINSIFKVEILIALIFLGNQNFAQNSTLRFEHIGVQQGLSSSWVTSIIQDRKGYLWIGTRDGLNKYDGYTFTTYKFDPFDSNSLSQNNIYTIWEDKQGFIWTSTFEGLCKFDRSTEKFTRFKPDPKSKFNDPNISSIAEDNHGMMWLGGHSGQLARFDRNTGKFYNESFDLGFRKDATDPMLRDGVNCILRDREGFLWVGTNTGLHKLNIQSGKDGQDVSITIEHYKPDPSSPDSLVSKIVVNIFEDRKGILWLSTVNGLNSFDKKTKKFKRYLHDPKNPYTISSNILASWAGGAGLAEDPVGNLWISTDRGLNKLNPERTIFTRFNYNSTNPNGLSTDNISSICVDRSGILWIGTTDGYLNKATLVQKPFGTRQHDASNQHSLSNDNVTAITEDKAGIIWIGTDGGGLNRWDRKNEKFTSYRHDPNDPTTLRFDVVYGLLEDREGNFWVCNGDKLSILNRQTGRFTHYNSNTDNYRDFDHRVIFSITEDAGGLIWIGTGHGIKSFDKKSKAFTSYYHDKADTTGISDYTAQAIFADSKNNIWIGYGSIATDRLDKKTGHITHYKHDPRNPSSISSNIVNSFYEDSKGNLWLATAAGGLCRFDYETEKFTAYTNKHGLPDNTVYSILEDKQNNLWLGTGNGISRLDPVKMSFTNYYYEDGLPGNVFAAGHRDRPARASGNDGILYFGGQNGLNFFDPSQINTNSQPAPVVITQFKLFNELVKGANEAKEIVLRHNENYFSFEFASLSFYNAEENQYEYQLEGVDKNWVNSGSGRFAAYTDIEPGKYVFRVRATNNDGVWNEEGVSVRVIIRPPWWRTWWAYCIYGLLFVVALWRIHMYQKQRVVAAERKKTQEKQLAQAKEIERAYHELKTTQQQLIQSEKMASLGELTAGIAHEIQNPLNFVNNFSEVNKELIDEMNEQWTTGNRQQAIEIAKNIRDNEEKINYHGKKAGAIVKSMLQHSRASTGQKELTDINALADEYLRLAYHGFRAKDKSFNAELKTSFDKEVGKINVVPQEVGRVVLNLVNNAFHAVHQKKKRLGDSFDPIVTVSSLKNDGKVEIRVSDNGDGIPEKIRDKIFQPFFTTRPAGEGTGLGLSLAYDIVKKGHGGDLTVDTKEGNGSEFLVVFRNI